MYKNIVKIILTTVCLYSLATTGHTQSLAKEQQKLIDMQAKIVALQQKDQKLADDITTAQNRLANMEKAASPHRGKLDKAEQVLKEAEARAAANPSETNQSKVDNAKFKYFLAQRKYKKNTEDLSAYQDRIHALQQQRQRNQKAISALQANVAKQQSRISRLKSKQTEKTELARQAQHKKQKEAEELARTRAKAKAAEAEIARLKALLAQQQAAEAVQVAVAAPAPVITKTKPPIDEEKLERRRELAEKRQEQFDEILEQATTATRTSQKNEQLKVTSSGLTFSHELQHLVDSQYYTEITVTSGKHQFEIGDMRWDTSVPEYDDGDTYVFLYDAREGIGPLLLWYNRDLLN